MKISELIAALQEVRNTFGEDVELTYPDRSGEGMQEITELITTLTASGQTVTVLCNYMDPIIPAIAAGAADQNNKLN